jgi:hypothetical protein
MHTTRAVVAAVVLLGTLNAAASQSALRHPGRVLEFQSQKPLSVAVKAWPNSKESGKDGSNCPLYGDSPLDSTTSGSSGAFAVTIKQDKATYTAVYCHSAYVTRVDRDIPNGKKNGEAVIPTPTFLYPVDAKAVAIDPSTLEDTVTRRIIGLLNDLAYIRKIDPELLKRAIGDLAKDVSTSSNQRSNVILRFTEIIQAWDE